LQDNLSSKKAIRYWRNSLNGVYEKHIDTWDYQLTYHFFKSRQLSVSPSKNLISNIGFGPSATHTLDSEREFSNLATEQLDANLIHPESVGTDAFFDAMVQNRFSSTVWESWLNSIARHLPTRLYIFLQAVYRSIR
jgi:hypothetical protein